MNHRKPNRLPGYDYSRDNLYFITSCVKDRVCCFGKIETAGTGRDVGTGSDLSLQRQPSSNPEIKIKSLSELMGVYKTTTSKQIHLAGFHEFEWQRSFHDRIIRDEESYRRISEYIINNPSEWQEDEFY